MADVKRKQILHESIVKMKESYALIMEEYIMRKYEQECNDARYKDTETNIFNKSQFKRLKEFINAEAKLYRESELRYSEIIEIINKLVEDIDAWIIGLLHRKGQGIHKAKSEYESEKYYLQEMLIRLKFLGEIVAYLDELEKKERELLENGIDIEAEPEYEAYLLNKCIMLNQVGYCKKKCTKLVSKLNKRVNNSDIFSADFLYRLAELNFDLQNYQETQSFIGKTIELLKKEIESGIESIERRYEVYDMLFSAYQFQVLSYEFCGDYEQAISILVSSKERSKDVLEEVLRVFETNLSDVGGIDFLAYSNDDFEYAIIKRRKVINKIDEIVKKPLFESEIFCFVQNYENQKTFNDIIRFENQKIRQRIEKKISNLSMVKKIYEANSILEHPCRLICEYVHILAHCLNEYAVTNLRKNKAQNEMINEKSAYKIICLSRALMLYVSEQLSIYKTCFATTYAESGDFEIAQKELRKVINSEVYAQTDVTTKAEIAFFYYIIDGMCKLDGVNEFFEEKDNTEFLNRYLNYCYRSFDYDAIALIRVYSFRNKLASMLQGGDLEVVANNFVNFSEEDEKGNSAFTEFVKNVYFQNKNRRLHHEYEKVKYMYSFLKCFFEQCNKKNADIVRSFEIFSYAFKYMYHYNIMKYNWREGAIVYVDFSHVESAIKLLEEIYPGVKWDDANRKLVSEYCTLKYFDETVDVDKFVDELIMDNKMYFIVCKDERTSRRRIGKAINKLREGKLKVRLRYFQTEENGLKEFIIFNTFFVIKNDFVDAQNIFVMTPIGKAEPCKYRIINNTNLVDNYFVNGKVEALGKTEDVMMQYRVASKRFAREENWENALTEMRYRNKISLVINMMYDNDCDMYSIKYKYKYHVCEPWKEAVLFSKTSVIAWLENLYSNEKYNKRKTGAHLECVFEEHFCSVKVIDEIINDDLIDTSWEDIKKAFMGIVFPSFTKMLLWRGMKGAFVSWRMVLIKENYPHNIIEEIKEILCCKGHGLNFKKKEIGEQINQWPEPHDYENSTEPFLFICHNRKKEELLKRELVEFFQYYNIPVWYDKEKELAYDNWKEKIEDVLKCQYCVGAVILMANEDFFDSRAVQDELVYMNEIKKDGKGRKYGVLPVVYGGIDSNEKQKEEWLKKKIGQASAERLSILGKIEDVIIPSSGKMITYLKEKETLREFTKREQEKGMEGSVLHACEQLGISYKRR